MFIISRFTLISNAIKNILTLSEIKAKLNAINFFN